MTDHYRLDAAHLPPHEDPADIDNAVKLCNCAACNATLTGEATYAALLAGRLQTRAEPWPPVAGRVQNGRPLCAACLAKWQHQNRKT